MSKKLRELMARKAQSVAAMRAISDKATGENRAMTAEETTEYDKHKADVTTTQAAIEREQEMLALEASTPAVPAVIPSTITAPAAATSWAGGAVEIRAGRITVVDNFAADPQLGFRTFGEFASAVGNAGRPNGSLDARFAAAPSLFSGEGAGADGGFLVPPQYATSIFTLAQTEDSLLPMTDNVEIESNSMAFPKDETVPWGTDGVRAYWQGEAGAGTGTKAKLGLAELRMRKLLSLVPVSDELLQDASALGSYLPGKMADSIRWKTNEAFIFGTGAGTPSGAFQTGAVVTVVKESGQATLTLLIQNIAKMISRLPAGSYNRAVWMMNNDVLPALFTLTLGNYPIYIPATEGAKGNPYGTLMGRPIMVTQHAKSFTNQGDVMLADWKYYRTITKAEGIQLATSLHLYFDADAVAFRAAFRVDGQSKIAAAITPANGSATLSPFVQLGAR